MCKIMSVAVRPTAAVDASWLNVRGAAFSANRGQGFGGRYEATSGPADGRDEVD